MPEITKELIGLIGLLVGAALTYLATRKTNATSLRIAQERLEADYRIAKEKLEAENQFAKEKLETENRVAIEARAAIKELLLMPEWELRSFYAIKKHIPGFADNGLRQLLVASGAVSFREQGTNKELWGLRKRNLEKLRPARSQKPFRILAVAAAPAAMPPRPIVPKLIL